MRSISLYLFFSITLVLAGSFLYPNTTHANTIITTAEVHNIHKQDVTNLQVQLKLDATNFDFTGPRPDGTDIHVTNIDGTVQLPFWVEFYNTTTQKASIWVKVPQIATGQRYSIVVSYGTTGASASYDATMQKLDNAGDVVAQWHFDEGTGNTVSDTTNRYVMTLNGNPVWTPTDGGNFKNLPITFSSGHALSFNGVNQYATVINPVSNTPANGSLEMWFKFNEVPVIEPGSYKYIFSNYSAMSSFGRRGFDAYLDASTGKITLRVNNEFAAAYTISGQVIGDIQYHHLVVTWDNTYGVKFFIDGHLQGRGRFSAPRLNNPETLMLGAFQTVNGLPLYGNVSIDELQITNHALSNQEIQAHFSRVKSIPFDQVIPSESNPVIYPNQSWEGTATYEPSVINDNGTLKMIYTSGWDYAGIGMAESTDGVTWTKTSNGPVLGQGVAGEIYASRGNFLKVGNEYRIYFADHNPNANIKLATSTDGVHFTVQTQNVINKDQVSGTFGWANTGMYFDGTDWWMLAEAYVGHDEWWQIHLFKSTDGGHTFAHVAGPLTSLQVSPGGMYGGPRSFKKIGDTYHLWYHAGYVTSTLPTAVWHATSTDMINWTPEVQPTVPIAGSVMGMPWADQTADTSIIEFNGKTFLFHDADNNSYGLSRIGVAVYDGSLINYVSQPYIVSFSHQPTGDVTSPKLTVTIPNQRNKSDVKGTVLIVAKATDNIGVTSIEYKIDGQLIGTRNTSPVSSVQWDSKTIVNGPHIITVTAYDAAGNASTVEIKIIVNNPTTLPCTNRKICSFPSETNFTSTEISFSGGSPSLVTNNIENTEILPSVIEVTSPTASDTGINIEPIIKSNKLALPILQKEEIDNSIDIQTMNQISTEDKETVIEFKNVPANIETPIGEVTLKGSK